MLNRLINIYQKYKKMALPRKSNILNMESMNEHDAEELEIDISQISANISHNNIEAQPKTNTPIPDIFSKKLGVDVDIQPKEVNIVVKNPPITSNIMSDMIISNAVMTECEMIIKIPKFKIIDIDFYESIVNNMNMNPDDIAISILKANIDGININEIIIEAILLQLTNKKQ